jgi:arylsulfatase A-like enzyme
MYHPLLSLALTALAGIAPTAANANVTGEGGGKRTLPSRIVFLILDDVGADTIAQVPTPNMDALAAGGIQFTRAYSHPWCKPTRDSLLRGTFAGELRGDSCAGVQPSSLDGDTPTFVRTLQRAGYLTGLVGKWHLGRANAEGLPWYFAPHALGFDHWLAGANTSTLGGCNPIGNTHDDGVFTQSAFYETERQVAATLALMDQADANGQPLFAWVAFTDAHSPWRLPPAHMLPPGFSIPPSARERSFFEAEVMALDFAIGQIVAALPPDAWVVLFSENGTPGLVTLPRTTRAKKSVFERGVHVPLVISGPGLPASIRTDPVQLYDLPATLLRELDLGTSGAGDGRSLFGPRPRHPFAFVRNPSKAQASRAVIEERYKLIDDGNTGALSFFDLWADPKEVAPLPLAGSAYARLFGLLGALPPI